MAVKSKLEWQENDLCRLTYTEWLEAFLVLR